MEGMQSPTHSYAFFSDPKYFDILDRFSVKDLEQFVKKRKAQKITKPYISNLIWNEEQLRVLHYIDSHLTQLNSSPSPIQPLRFIVTGFAGNFAFVLATQRK